MPMHVLTDGSNKYCLPVSCTEGGIFLDKGPEEDRRHGLLLPVDVNWLEILVQRHMTCDMPHAQLS